MHTTDRATVPPFNDEAPYRRGDRTLRRTVSRAGVSPVVSEAYAPRAYARQVDLHKQWAGLADGANHMVGDWDHHPA